MIPTHVIKATLSTLALTAALLTPAALRAQAQTYTIDSAHSQTDFSIRHLAISNVHGRFAIKSGTVLFDPKEVTKSSVEALIDVASVDTGTPARDKHLNSPDFFDTAKFPTATFKSTAVKAAGDGFDVTGDLTLHGVTKPVTLHMDQPSKEQAGNDSKLRRGFNATTTIDRKDFGLTCNGSLKSGDNVLGDDVKLTFEIEATRS